MNKKQWLVAFVLVDFLVLNAVVDLRVRVRRLHRGGDVEPGQHRGDWST